MADEPTNQQKRRELLRMLERGLVMVHLDPRAIGVVVPDRYKSGPVLKLQIAYGFRLPALEIDEEGVFAVLSFKGANFGCTLPWESIYALTMPDEADTGVAWTDAMPHELRPVFEEDQAEESNDRSDLFEIPREPGRKPALRVVEGGGDAPVQDQPRGRPRLRLVKD
jgi:hypothetical protein